MFELLSVQPEHAALWDLWDEAVPQLDESGAEVYPFKDTLTSYYDLDTANWTRRRARRGHDGWDGVVTAICRARVVEHIDPTTNHSVSNVRLHKAFPAAADRNPVMRAMLQFVAELLAPSELSPLLSEHGEPRFEAMVSAYRVTRGGHERFELGEPGPEGIHQDSADLTVVSLMDGGTWPRMPEPTACGRSRSRAASRAPRTSRRGGCWLRRRCGTGSTRSSSSTATSSTRRARSRRRSGPAVRDVWTLEVRRPRRKGG